MTAVDGFGDKVGFIWSIADLLRGDVKAHEYGQFILPFVVLRRLDCVLEPTKADVIARAKSLEGKVTNVDPILERVSGAPFYNVSPLTFTDLLNDDKNVRANLTSYLAGFSSGAADVLEKYKFAERIDTLDKAGLLYQVLAKFADIDLHPDAVPNHAMGYIFEELLRRFSEMANETAGEHFTPREVVNLMVNILFVEDEKALSGVAPVRTLFDPACGTGGLLSSGQDYLAALNPDAHLEVYGQELNPETWAICRSDMLIKGEKPENIVLGNSLSADGHPDERFDYMLANPPFGVDWKKYAEPILAEAENEGFDGRFGAGTPRSSDGSLLFLQHMLSKMKPVADDPSTPDVIEGGSRLAIVFSGSPLFSGAAGSGESNIRKWIIENDWLEAVVALPDQLFYNTSISTYFWVLTNRKRPERRGKVLLLDARNEFEKMRKSLGQKRKFISSSAIDEVTRLYMDAADASLDDPRVKVLPNEAFGFQRVTVEQPLRRRWVISPDAVAAVGETKAWTKAALGGSPQEVFASLVGQEYADEKSCLKAVQATAPAVPLPVAKELVKAAAVPDPAAPVSTDRKGQPLPDPDLRDAENVPLGEDPDGYLKREVHPYAPEAWIDHSKTKVGYEIPFTRQFYVYTPPRPVAELDAEIAEREARIHELLGGLR
ncbi:SAM-dependent DNA methyltransferase [Nocardioides sp. Y6]|uniref:site-specific DNA-methyltransferase (adenine-specific) n=1 Tax=Nocardioides malaquae TaxID=2773426 RepID=A0ABR9RUM6_9ACTN|nr:class I SAM-dependent DNA methyltransferase [Nocardioides malaquae]MBE7325286.1 SAM-dependent DNA methyltransferase [Nocardioides malaquae]